MRLSLYTTVHPGTLPYLHDWYQAVQCQSDKDFDLWIGIDAVDINEAKRRMGGEVEAHWINAEADDTPARVRERAFQALTPHADAVIMTDADDVIHPDRVASARRSLYENDSDVIGCALQLVNEEKRDLGVVLPPERYASTAAVLPNYNIFGLGNTVYRTDILESCLPIPNYVVLVDWFLVMRAWLGGARFKLDPTVHVKYRQHQGSTLKLLPPFTTKDIVQATTVVRSHFRTVKRVSLSDVQADRMEEALGAAARVEKFAEYISDVTQLKQYVEALNSLDPLPLWWSCVAHPKLEYLWTKEINN